MVICSSPNRVDCSLGLRDRASSLAFPSLSSASLGSCVFPSSCFLLVASQVFVGGQVSVPTSFGRCVFSASMASVLLAFSGWVLSSIEGRAPASSFLLAGHTLVFLASASLEKLGLLLQAPGLCCLRPVITTRLIITTPGRGYKRLPLPVWGKI